MRLFACPSCQQTLYFENFQCNSCGHALAYLSDAAVLTAVEPAVGAAGRFVALGAGVDYGPYRPCGNQIDYAACNWAVRDTDKHRFCLACRLNDVIPNLADPSAKQAWIKLEQSKRRLIYTLLQLRLPIAPRAEDPERGLAFAFKQDVPGQSKVFIAHDHGLITINVAEADAAIREKTRADLGEGYRTVLGHFRHEIGHYYWDRLLAASALLDPFRRLFGDERAPYDDAVTAHYAGGPPADWQARFVSAYASMHPWEDWAESWAHYLHMVDTLETAQSFGLAIRAKPAGGGGDRKREIGTIRLDFGDFDALSRAWVPLTTALNSLNRSMGLPDPYPFVLSAPAVQKLRFVHRAIRDLTDAAATGSASAGR